VGENDRIELFVTDITGKAVFATQNSPESGKLEVIWNAKELNKGIYFYHVKPNNGRVYSGKMVKM